jgi:CHAT domain-containing protein
MLYKNNLIRIIFLSLTLILSKVYTLPTLAQLEEIQTPPKTLSEKILDMERGLGQEFETYFDRDLAEVTQSPEEIAKNLAMVGEETNSNPAVLWVIPREDHLHLVLVTPQGEPIVEDLYDVPSSLLKEITANFNRDITAVRRQMNLEASQQLHQWIIEPFEKKYLQPQGIDTLLFCLGNGVRGLPLAALHDGNQFLIEKYSVTRIPAFNLIDTNYKNIQEGRILAMGAEEFTDKNPLPAVPVELNTIMRELWASRNPQKRWDGLSFLNEDFTIENLAQMLGENSFDIVHLATHANFTPGDPENSYIQFWENRLSLDQINSLNWQDSSVSLLVLSACQTALGDDQAEMGFAGLALQSGVKSVLGSLWSVSDTGTLALMGEFYRQLGINTTKTEALRQTQLQMLRGEVRIDSDRLLFSRRSISIPSNLNRFIEEDFSHPYYWASFTLISSPW